MLKFETTASTLTAALKTLKPALDHRSTHVILSNVLAKRDGQDVTLTATDLDTSASVTLKGAWQEGDGGACISHGTLVGLLKGSQKFTPVVIGANAEKANVYIGDAKSEVPILPSTDFPAMPWDDPDAAPVDLLVVKAEQIHDAWKRVGFCVSTEEMRLQLRHARITHQVDRIRIEATDGHRLSRFTFTPAYVAPKDEWKTSYSDVWITPDIVKILPKYGDVYVSLLGHHLIWSWDGGTAASKMDERRFPDTDKVVRKDSLFLSVQREQLANALKPFVARKIRLNSVTIKARAEGCYLYDESEGSEMTAKLPSLTIPYAHPAFDYKVNAKYFLEGVESFDCTTLYLGFHDDQTATGVESNQMQIIGESGVQTYIVMPTRK